MSTVRQQVREALDGHPSPVNIHEVAAAVASRVENPRDALLECLPALVRDVIVTARSVTPTSSEPVRESAKLAGRREWWQSQLEARYATADGFKRLADHTVADLEALADVTDEMARRNAARAQVWRRLAKHLQDAGGSRVADLPSAVLAAELGGAL